MKHCVLIYQLPTVFHFCPSPASKKRDVLLIPQNRSVRCMRLRMRKEKVLMWSREMHGVVAFVEYKELIFLQKSTYLGQLLG